MEMSERIQIVSELMRRKKQLQQRVERFRESALKGDEFEAERQEILRLQKEVDEKYEEDCRRLEKSFEEDGYWIYNAHVERKYQGEIPKGTPIEHIFEKLMPEMGVHKCGSEFEYIEYMVKHPRSKKCFFDDIGGRVIHWNGEERKYKNSTAYYFLIRPMTDEELKEADKRLAANGLKAGEGNLKLHFVYNFGDYYAKTAKRKKIGCSTYVKRYSKEYGEVLGLSMNSWDKNKFGYIHSY